MFSRFVIPPPRRVCGCSTAVGTITSTKVSRHLRISLTPKPPLAFVRSSRHPFLHESWINRVSNKTLERGTVFLLFFEFQEFLKSYGVNLVAEVRARIVRLVPEAHLRLQGSRPLVRRGCDSDQCARQVQPGFRAQDLPRGGVRVCFLMVVFAEREIRWTTRARSASIFRASCTRASRHGERIFSGLSRRMTMGGSSRIFMRHTSRVSCRAAIRRYRRRSWEATWSLRNSVKSSWPSRRSSAFGKRDSNQSPIRGRICIGLCWKAICFLLRYTPDSLEEGRNFDGHKSAGISHINLLGWFPVPFPDENQLTPFRWVCQEPSNPPQQGADGHRLPQKADPRPSVPFVRGSTR